MTYETTVAILKRRQQLALSRRPVAAPIGGRDSGSTTLGELTSRAAIPPRRGSFLAQLAGLAPEGDLLELGSNVGIGTAFLADVARTRGSGHVYSVEGVPGIAEAAERTIKILGLGEWATIICQDFMETLTAASARQREFSFAFIDGSHTYAPTLQYVNAVEPLMRRGGMIVIDDVSQTAGIRKAWRELAADQRFPTAWSDGRFGVLSVARKR
jgi:predicted O-methyltransferase YrrM